MSLLGCEWFLQVCFVSIYNSVGLLVWCGGLVDGDEVESLIVVCGSLEIYINVVIFDGSYLIIVDNCSGKIWVIDENDIVVCSDLYGDYVDVLFVELLLMLLFVQG